MSVVVILGSARGESHTAALVDAVLAGREATRIDLRNLNVQPYAYGGAIDRDDFIQVAEALVAHQTIVLATPVYWYAMSGLMKNMFDRLTDLITVRTVFGPQLKGRHVFALACGSEPELPTGFEVPFRETAAYFGMRYHGAFYAQTTATGLLPASGKDAERFGDRLFAAG